MKYQFQNVILQVEVNEIYKIDKFTQMAIEYPELLDSKEKLAQNDVKSETQNLLGEDWFGAKNMLECIKKKNGWLPWEIGISAYFLEI